MKTSFSLPRTVLLSSSFISIFCIFFTYFISPLYWDTFWYLIKKYDRSVSWLVLGTTSLTYLFVCYNKTPKNFILKLNILAKTIDKHWLSTTLITWLTLCLLSLNIYHNHRLSMDEYCPYFQANIFASLHIHGTYPAEWINFLVPPKFQNYFINVNSNTGAVMSAYWPGFAILLTPFIWVKAPWMCNPTLTILSLIVIRKISVKLGGNPICSFLAVLFSISSPVFIINGISYYSMTAHMLFNLLFIYTILLEKTKFIILAGFIGGFAMTLHNPIPHVLFGIPWILYLGKQNIKNFVYVGIGYLIVFGFLGIGWSQITASIMSSGIPKEPIDNAPFSILEGLSQPISVFLDLVQLPNGFILLSRDGGIVKTWLWTTPFVPLLALFAGSKRILKAQTYPRLMIASLMLTFVGYFFIPYDQGHGWGYRYIHSAWGVFPILAALVSRSLNKSFKINEKFTAGIILASIISLTCLLPFRLFQVEDFVSYSMERRPPLPISEPYVAFHNGNGYKSIDNIQNDPWLRDNRVMMLVPKDSETVQKITEQFFNKPILWEGNDYGFTLVNGISTEKLNGGKTSKNR